MSKRFEEEWKTGDLKSAIQTKSTKNEKMKKRLLQKKKAEGDVSYRFKQAQKNTNLAALNASKKMNTFFYKNFYKDFIDKIYSLVLK